MKAQNAMTEAIKSIKKDSNAVNSGRLKELEYRMKFIEDFIKAHQLATTDPIEMLKICDSIINNPDAEVSVRIGDVLAFVVEYFYKIKDYKNANEYLKKITSKKININPYLDPAIIKNIYSEVGIANNNIGEVIDREDMGEEIVEEININ